MSRKRGIFAVVAAVGCVPLILCAPYVMQAWQGSPMDSHDYVFVIAFALTALAAILFTHQSRPVFQRRIALAAGMLFCGFVFSRIISLNASAIFCAILFWWFWTWLFCGARLAFNLLPSFLILLLSVVSSVYWICVFFGVSQSAAYRLKLLAMLVFIVAEVLILHYRWLPKLGVVVFSMGMLAAAVVMVGLDGTTRTSPTCKVDFQPVAGAYIGHELDRDEGFQRFFKTSHARHYKFAGDDADFTLLSVDCGKNIHEIHPASHCLRTSGWRIEDEKPVTFTLEGRNYTVSEVKATRGGHPIILWVWYSNDNVSTGNFICFRRLWRSSGRWSTYQLGIFGMHNIEESRKRLQGILSAIMVK